MGGVWLACDWRVVGVWLACGWCVVGVWLACGWRVVGVWLVCGWRVAVVWLAFVCRLYTSDAADVTYTVVLRWTPCYNMQLVHALVISNVLTRVTFTAVRRGL